MSLRSKNYTLIDEISESESDDGPEGYYGRKKIKSRQGYQRGQDRGYERNWRGSERNEFGSERENGRGSNERSERENGRGSDERSERENGRGSEREKERSERRRNAEYSETEMNRFYAGNPAPRANAERVAEINDEPFRTENFYHATDASSCKHNVTCSKCKKRISIWTMIADEMSTIVVVILILIILYLVYRRPRIDTVPIMPRTHRFSGQANANPTSVEPYF